mmetsp:Transcript_47559/g.99503  ORF Transcript_47559/g.99503 Transcript_47559/m.99503 type:complete len:108 (-) Transcript_47559:271-594(-)
MNLQENLRPDGCRNQDTSTSVARGPAGADEIGISGLNSVAQSTCLLPVSADEVVDSMMEEIVPNFTCAPACVVSLDFGIDDPVRPLCDHVRALPPTAFLRKKCKPIA